MAKRKQSKDINTESRIVGFVCNWEAYSGVEMAGVNKKEYPADIKLVRLTCLGRLHLGLVLKAFELGADGVMLLGCPPERCNYEDGMKKAKELFAQARKVLHLLGIDPRRLALVEVPLGGDDIVAREISAFARQISKAGIQPLRSTTRIASPA